MKKAFILIVALSILMTTTGCSLVRDKDTRPHPLPMPGPPPREMEERE